MPIIIGKPPSQNSGGTDHTADIALIKAKDQSQDTLISEASAKNIEQDTRINSVESSVLTKADLISGKVPLTQLPDLPVGRKVSVANTAARLALIVYPDITIAYQIDTADAWVLDSSEDPSVEANWDKLGNAQAQGVTAFNSRTGVVVPTLGDYTTDMVEPTTTRTYTSPAERTTWNAKATPEQVDTKISLFNDSLVGVFAPLENGKVPSAYLPAASGVGGATDEQLARISSLEQQTTTLSSKDSELESLTRTVDSKVDSVASNNVILDQRLSTLENRPAATDYSTQITALQDKEVLQDTKLTSLDASLLNKAPLVAGKVPYENLPEFPVGRKVNVANTAARLALSSYADLTIAYQSDTGDAWGLDANADPAISANWSKLGNAQGIGVASFNGRTGNIGPQTGDYITDQVSETPTKRFVTSDQISDWNSRETTTGSQAKAAAAQIASKTYADSTFLPLSQKGVNNGVAPLDSDGKVPESYLPTKADSIAPLIGEWSDVKATKANEVWYTNNDGYDRDVYILSNWMANTNSTVVNLQKGTTGPVYKFESVAVNTSHTQVTYLTVPAGYRYKLTLSPTRSVLAWFEMNRVLGTTFTPVSEKGKPNGVAPLGSDGKVPLVNLPSMSSGGEWVIPVTNYNDVTGSRVKSTWYTNTGQYDRKLRVVTNLLVGKEASFIHVRDKSNKVYIIQSADPANSVVYSQIIEATIPSGWSYQVVLATATARTIVSWLELDTVAGSTFVPVSEKGQTNGVAPLDANSLVPIANLPTFLPQSKRIWRDVKSLRTVGTWYDNTSPNEREVHVRASLSGSSNRFVSLQIRENSSATVFVFNATVLNPLGTTGITYADSNTITVPAGWQYQLASVGGSTDALTERWYELY